MSDGIAIANQLKTGEIDVGGVEPSLWDDLATAANITRVTFGPTASTVPAASCPRTIGSGEVHSCLITWRSLRQTPLAAIFTSTSPGCGSSSCTRSIFIGWRYS